MMADCFSSFSLMRSGKSALAWQVAHLDPPCAADDDVALDDASDAVPLRRHAGWNPGPCDRDLGVARIVGHLEDEALLGSEKFPGRISATDFSLHAERLIVSTELGVRLRCAVYDDLTIRSGCSRGQKWAGEHHDARRREAAPLEHGSRPLSGRHPRGLLVARRRCHANVAMTMADYFSSSSVL